MFVNESVESEAIAPAGCKISYVDVAIAGGFHLAPEKQGILSRLGLAAVGFFDCYVLNLFNKHNVQSLHQRIVVVLDLIKGSSSTKLLQ